MLDSIEILDAYDDEEIRPFRIIDGEFKGLVIRLGRAWFNDDEQLSFEVDIIEGKIEDEQSERLNQFLGSIIMGFIKEQMSLYQERENDKSAN